MPPVDYPEDCIQALNPAGRWWEEDTSTGLVRGKLVWAHVQFFSEIPLQLIPKRAEERGHKYADVEPQPLRADGRRAQYEVLPIAAMPRLHGADAFAVNRCKRRPCLILAGAEPTYVEDRYRRGQPNWSVAPFALAAPYYTADQELRAGYRPDLVERIRHGHYRQFFYERLPMDDKRESILRFDQMFPVSHNSVSFNATGYRLAPDALALLDEWFDWYVNHDSGDEELRAFQRIMTEAESEAGR